MSEKFKFFWQVAIAAQKASRNFSNQGYKLALLTWVILCFCSQTVLAKPSTTTSFYLAQKPDPNEERFLQPQPPVSPLPEEEEDTPSQPPTPPQASPQTENSETIAVKTVIVSGTSIFTEDDLANIIQPLLNRNVTLQELQEATDAITQRYLEQGYITSRAILDQNNITPDGTVTIQVVEGSLEAIEIQGTERLKESYIRNRVELGTGKPLNTGDLEDQLRLLRADPLLDNVEANLRTGSNASQSILVVRVTEANPWSGGLSIDNYSPPSVGSERIVGNLSNANLTGNGDNLGVAFSHTTRSGADTLDFNYRLPVNPMNGTVQLRASFNRNEVVIDDFKALGIRGESELYEISYRQPLVRTPREELALSLGFSYQDGQTFTFAGPTPFGFGPNDEGITTTSVFKFGQDYLLRQPSGSWAFRSQFSIGTALFGATENSEPRVPDGQFLSWLGQIQRVQVINENNFLIGSIDIQLAGDGLLSSQQFVIGGGQSVRGFRQNVRAGDSGVRFSLEDRITLERDEAGIPTFQFAPFLDLGWVWNSAQNSNPLPDQTFIMGVGAGILWTPLPNFNIRLDYGVPLIDLEDRGENAQDNGFYFRAGYQF